MQLQQPNARGQARRTAGARHERTLFAVACTPLLGKGGHRTTPIDPPLFVFLPLSLTVFGLFLPKDLCVKRRKEIVHLQLKLVQRLAYILLGDTSVTNTTPQYT
jgi:hypothetical protein